METNSSSLTPEAVVSLVQRITFALLGPETAFTVESKEGADASVIHVRVAQESIGKIVGRQGRTVQSLRTILSAVGRKLDHQYVLNIEEYPLERSGGLPN